MLTAIRERSGRAAFTSASPYQSERRMRGPRAKQEQNECLSCAASKESNNIYTSTPRLVSRIKSEATSWAALLTAASDLGFTCKKPASAHVTLAGPAIRAPAAVGETETRHLSYNLCASCEWRRSLEEKPFRIRWSCVGSTESMQGS